MRTALPALLLIISANVALAESPRVRITQPPSHTVYLDGVSDLAQLRERNPDHYARAQRILAAADYLCAPGPPRTELAAASARGVDCSAVLLRTSNPPKFTLSFLLDDTRYIALVTLTYDPPRASPAR